MSALGIRAPTLNHQLCQSLERTLENYSTLSRRIFTSVSCQADSNGGRLFCSQTTFRISSNSGSLSTMPSKGGTYGFALLLCTIFYGTKGEPTRSKLSFCLCCKQSGAVVSDPSQYPLLSVTDEPCSPSERSHMSCHSTRLKISQTTRA